MAPSAPDVPAVLSYLRGLQDSICAAIEQTDGTARFRRDRWQRAEGGGGEAACCATAPCSNRPASISHMSWARSCPRARRRSGPSCRTRSGSQPASRSCLHPLNPYVPTTHANVRFFCATKQDTVAWWFGGGFDLTPFYPFDEDVLHWHRTAQQACAPFGDDVYTRHKEWCDRYFFLKHRNETRGVGGLFFDDLNEWGFERCFAYQRSVGDHFLPAYLPIVARRRATPYGERERSFQLYRRGRYVEFNLVYDRGTSFGLQSGGRTESILMSLPPLARWEYDWHPAARLARSALVCRLPATARLAARIKLA